MNIFGRQLVNLQVFQACFLIKYLRLSRLSCTLAPSSARYLVFGNAQLLTLVMKMQRRLYGVVLHWRCQQSSRSSAASAIWKMHPNPKWFLLMCFLIFFNPCVAGENLAMQRENEKTAAVPVQQQANLGKTLRPSPLASKIYLLSICILIFHKQRW